MTGLLLFVLITLVSPFRSKCRLEAKSASHRHQLMVMRLQVKGCYFLQRPQIAGRGHAMHR
jgi:hypothetical protein